MAGAIAGLFGKLPAHGDFVRRGWADATVAAIDHWLSETIAAARSRCDDATFDAWMRAAPLWRGYVPAGQLGPQALHLGVAPSIDRAGRLFPIAAGIAADAAAAWRHAVSAGAVVDNALYDALAGRADADAVIEALAISIDADESAGADDDVPAVSTWWLLPDGPPARADDAVDAALLGQLMGGQSMGGDRV
jgi:type VI secretion system ImpM family protein